jgi:hypothetical protein
MPVMALPLPPTSSWYSPGKKVRFGLVGFVWTINKVRHTCCLIQAQERIVNEEETGLVRLAVQSNITLQLFQLFDAGRVAVVDEAERVALSFCCECFARCVAIAARAGSVRGVGPRECVVGSAACSGDDGGCRCDDDVCEGKLHVGSVGESLWLVVMLMWM